MTSENLKQIVPQSEFLQLVDTIDQIIAERGFAPKEHYAQIYQYQAEHANDIRGYNEISYWHTNVPIEDPEDMNKYYYTNAKKQTVHLSIKIADNLDERNAVHFGGNSPVATKHFKSFVAKLRRYAKVANVEIEQQSEIYYATPEGISSKLDKEFYKFKDATKSIFWNQNYTNVLKTTGGNSWKQILQNERTDMIGKIQYDNDSFSYGHDHPVRVKFVIFFEDSFLQKELEELACPVYGQLKLHNQQVDLYEQELIVKRLKGVDNSEYNLL